RRASRGAGTGHFLHCYFTILRHHLLATLTTHAYTPLYHTDIALRHPAASRFSDRGSAKNRVGHQNIKAIFMSDGSHELRPHIAPSHTTPTGSQVVTADRPIARVDEGRSQPATAY